MSLPNFESVATRASTVGPPRRRLDYAVGDQDRIVMPLPGHAWIIWPDEPVWLRVPLEQFAAFGFKTRHNSFRNAEYVFLSESGDADDWLSHLGGPDPRLVQETLLWLPKAIVEVPAEA